jgi:uncharacterized protein (DUF1684 family)
MQSWAPDLGAIVATGTGPFVPARTLIEKELRMKAWILAVAMLALPGWLPAQDVEAWRAQRLERLQKPDGWLTLVGLHWIESGSHSVGHADDNDIVLSTGPAHLGRILFTDKAATFEAAPGAGATVDGQALTGPIVLKPDTAGASTTVAFDAGQASFQLIERNQRFALRVRDARAATRTGFKGIENYPADDAWRFEARFEPHPPGQTIKIANVLNMIEPMPNPGAVVFVKDGKTYRLEAVDEGDGQLFLIFADRTNARETYGAGRFLYAAPAVDGKTVVDFNKANNPPCAFNAYSTCPLPPPENRLDLAVTAGEKRYAGATH